MQLLWDHKDGSATGQTLYRYKGGEVSHYMAFAPDGRMVFHRMINQEPEGNTGEIMQETGCNGLVQLQYDIPFQLVPAAFSGAAVPGLPGLLSCHPVLSDYKLCHSGWPDIPMALPFFARATARAAAYKDYVLIHVHQESALVAFFRDGKPALFNAFPAANEAEALYFATAPVKKAGMNPAAMRIEIMAEEHAAHTLLQMFRRFLHDVAYCPVELPYALGQLPPYADIASLMHTLPQCVLQAG